MADARLRADWAHTSNLLCLLANINRNPQRRSRPFQPSDFDPFAGPRRKGGKVSVARLADEIMKYQDAKGRNRQGGD